MIDKRISVMQVIDSLAFGGAERMAINLANMLPRDRFNLHLCSTRKEGPLANQLSQDVGRLALNRKTRLSEPRAIYELIAYIRKHRIQILHCHEKTVFICSLASVFCPSVAIVWHDHFGPVTRSRWLYKLGTLRVRAVISVNEELAKWARQEVGFPSDRVFFVNNFVVPRRSDRNPNLPERIGPRIVCTANITPTKDIMNLVKAMARVHSKKPDVQTLIVGTVKNRDHDEYYENVHRAIADLDLTDRIFFLGSRDDVDQILAKCDIGVICSMAEGLPLALIEYGMAGLAAVSTMVGQCAEVLDNGRLGVLVPPGDSQSLADAILQLLESDSRRKALGQEFQRVTMERYSSDRNIGKIVEVYDAIIR